MKATSFLLRSQNYLSRGWVRKSNWKMRWCGDGLEKSNLGELDYLHKWGNFQPPDQSSKYIQDKTIFEVFWMLLYVCGLRVHCIPTTKKLAVWIVLEANQPDLSLCFSFRYWCNFYFGSPSNLLLHKNNLVNILLGFWFDQLEKS